MSASRFEREGTDYYLPRPTAIRRPEMAGELHPAAILDLIARLEDLARLMAWQLPEARDCEHAMALELGRLRALEAAAMIATMAEIMLGESKQAAVGTSLAEIGGLGEAGIGRGSVVKLAPVKERNQ